ncbi:deleted in malignant brain tumors 1 protein-like [Lingula anatina]|uniref:Deleted in malignant brain tumors 1 protein-like n=1 Tax=Lingula anatina TaxID=7574 RepID=A0A2R2MKB0_LINAN|nr:deleted in malignant brain tumors 1 protein-like [Lingula anatina]|eukprot:XP_023930635.1 deleted in malignant brain tumors 1 protein-like [Lingula anatina]
MAGVVDKLCWITLLDKINAIITCHSHFVADGDIRLRDGNTQYQGRVEIYHNGEWRRVCDEGWGINDAKVACRQLGFEGAHTAYINYNPRGPGSFWLSNLNCAGTEGRLSSCTSRGWGTISSYCAVGDNDDAGVVCKSPGDGAVRLVNTSSPYEGRVEVYYAGEWGRVCEYNWGLNDAKVVCKQLGLAGAHTSFRDWNPRGTGKYWLFNVNCAGTESNITQCTHGVVGVYNSNCRQSYYDDAGVICYGDGDGALRLINTSNAYEGRLEIFYSGRWGRVCDYGWDLTSADVACKQLGFTGAHTHVFNKTPRGTGLFWIQNLNCHGGEARLADCSHGGVGVVSSSSCSQSSSDDAGVLCKGPNDGEIRLIGPSQYFGRVEIFYAGGWGRVCKYVWSMNDAKVACRQLGFSGALNYWTNWTPRGTSRVVLDQLNCAGTESRLDACTHGWIGYPSESSCSATSAVDAGVACEAPGDGQLRLVDGNGYNSGRVEIKFAGVWKRICDWGWGSNDAAVVCRQLGYSGYVRSAAGWNPRGSGSYWLQRVGCMGTESNLTDCTHGGVGAYTSSYCGLDRYDDAGVYCQGYLPGVTPPNTTTTTPNTQTTRTTVAFQRGPRCYTCSGTSSCGELQTRFTYNTYITCSYGYVCHIKATAYRNYALDFGSSTIAYSYSRGCRDRSFCTNREFLASTCTGTGASRVCRECCTSDYCNSGTLDTSQATTTDRGFSSKCAWFNIFFLLIFVFAWN